MVGPGLLLTHHFPAAQPESLLLIRTMICAIKPAGGTWVHDENMLKNARIILWLFCGLLPALAGCQVSLSEQQYRQEVDFRGSWDYAIGRLSYDEVVKSWGPPTSLLGGYAAEGSTLDAQPILANWQWSHSLPLVVPHSPDVSLKFGQRMELAFNRGTKLLVDWKYWEWGPSSLSQKHEDSQKILLPTSGVPMTQ